MISTWDKRAYWAERIGARAVSTLPYALALAAYIYTSYDDPRMRPPNIEIDMAGAVTKTPDQAEEARRIKEYLPQVSFDKYLDLTQKGYASVSCLREMWTDGGYYFGEHRVVGAQQLVKREMNITSENSESEIIKAMQETGCKITVDAGLIQRSIALANKTQDPDIKAYPIQHGFATAECKGSDGRKYSVTRNDGFPSKTVKELQRGKCEIKLKF